MSSMGNICILLGSGCTIPSGKDGDFAAVRTIGNAVLVGKTKYSYVYTQPLRSGGDPLCTMAPLRSAL
jgi:hypothetical protein